MWFHTTSSNSTASQADYAFLWKRRLPHYTGWEWGLSDIGLLQQKNNNLIKIRAFFLEEIYSQILQLIYYKGKKKKLLLKHI